jgi:hypothetical protein
LNAAAMAAEIGKPVGYRQVDTSGAERAAQRIAQLL